MSDIERRLRELGERARLEQPSASLPPGITRRVKRRRLATIGMSLVVAVGLAFGGVVAVGAFEPPAEIGPAEGTDDVLIDYHRTGGVAADDVRLIVNANGVATVTVTEGDESTTTEHKLNAADLRGLEAAMEEVDWRARAAEVRYGPVPPVDAVRFNLRHDGHVVTGFYRIGPPELTALVGYLDTLLGDLRIEREVADPAPTLTLSDTTLRPGDVVEFHVEAGTQYMWGAATGLDAQRGDDWERLFHWATYHDQGPEPIPATRHGGVDDVGYTGPATFKLRIPRLEPGTYRITKDFSIVTGAGSEGGEFRETQTAEVRFEVTGDAPAEEPFGAIWPEDTLAEAEVSCAGDQDEGDRDNPVAVAVAFVTGVLGWDAPEHLVLRESSQGRRDIEIRRSPDDDGPRADGPAIMAYMNEVLDGCWSVGSVARLPDKRPTGVSVGVTGRKVSIGFDDLGASSVTLVVGHGENEVRVDGERGQTLIHLRLDYTPKETGHFLLLFTDESGAVFTVSGGPLPAGDFIAG